MLAGNKLIEAKGDELSFKKYDEVYFCPVDNIVSVKDEKCPICGGETVIFGKENFVFVCPVDKKIYHKVGICPGHPHIYLDPALIVYRCPLHKEIVSETPGKKCPICGRNISKEDVIILKYQCTSLGVLSKSNNIPGCEGKIKELNKVEPYRPVKSRNSD